MLCLVATEIAVVRRRRRRRRRCERRENVCTALPVTLVGVILVLASCCDDFLASSEIC